MLNGLLSHWVSWQTFDLVDSSQWGTQYLVNKAAVQSNSLLLNILLGVLTQC